MAFRENSFSYRYRGLFRFLLVVFVICLGLGLFYGMSLFGPRKVKPNEVSAREFGEDVLNLLKLSEEYEQQFLEVSGLREPSEEDLKILSRAVELQSQYLEAIGGFDRVAGERLESLEKLYQDEVAQGLLKESLEFEEEAMRLGDGEEPMRALKPYRQALRIQRKIDQEYPKSRARNVTRSMRLERQVAQLSALPLYRETTEAEKRAMAAVEEKKWVEAKVAFAEAIESQQELNMRFRGLIYADLNRLKHLEVELASLKSSNLYDEIESFVTQGDAEFKAEHYRQAADHYQKAARLQAKLNKEFENSRFASSVRLDELEALKQTSLSQELGESILKQVAQLDEYLESRNHWQAVEIVNGLYQQSERFKANFPRSTILGEELSLKLQYLSFIQGDIAFFQDRIYGQLVPLPKNAEIHMSRTEVSQALYSSIMLANPSRNKGDRLPSDSVTWAEAKEFCQKLSWILAKPVRLPTKVEFREAVGSLRYVKLDDVAWFSENCDGRTQEIATKAVNRQGYHDLLGNVAEWLESVDLDGSAEAYIAGGSSGDSIDVLADIPVIIGNAASRNRLTGFRFVVDMKEKE